MLFRSVFPNPENVAPVLDTEIGPPQKTNANIENYHPPRLTRAANTPMGMLAAGNTDINKLPADTKFTSYESTDGKETLIPVMKGWTPAQAITLHQSEPLHSHLGVFDSPENAQAYAEAIRATPRDKSGVKYIAPSLHPGPGPSYSRRVQYPTGQVVAIYFTPLLSRGVARIASA